MEIRKVKSTDAEAWVELKNIVWENAYASIMPEEVFVEQAKSKQNRIDDFKSRKLNKNGHVGYVAEDNGKIVALADGVSISLYEHYEDLGYADLCALYILPEYQHLGLGKKLFDKMVEDFKKQGSKKMVIGVLKDNIQARKAYEKWGGVIDTYTTKFVKLGKEYEEVFYLYKLD